MKMCRIDAGTGQREIRIVHLKSSGVITCINTKGKVAWQALTNCGWDKEVVGDVPIQPSLETVRLSDRSDEQHVVCTGANGLAVITQVIDIIANRAVFCFAFFPFTNNQKKKKIQCSGLRMGCL
jgi:hypothetical protein